MRQLVLMLILTLTGIVQAAAEPAESAGPIVIYPTEGSFDDMIDNIKMAIEERGMLVSSVLHASDMLNRTGPDLGYQPVFKRAEAVEFCSAVLAHRMTQAAVENVSLCPFTIAVYIRTDEPEKLYVSYRRPHLAGDAADVTSAIYEMLDGIVRDSIE